MSTIPLKPCPLCGGPVTLEERGERLVVIKCQEGSPCIGSGVGQYIDAEKRESAIRMWNTRAPRDPAPVSDDAVDRAAAAFFGEQWPKVQEDAEGLAWVRGAMRDAIEAASGGGDA